MKENALEVVSNKPLTAVQIRANCNLIQEVMQTVMKPNVHYGTIPGTNKPTLFKAGSEKILSTFRIAVEVEVEDLSTSDCFRYRVKTRGYLPNNELVGCGIGECSTDEEKYKWRGAVIEKEFETTPEDRRRIKYGRPSQYNKTGETKQVRTNPADLANTALKMAKKRAQIDLTLTATGASDVFDQDIEDLPAEYVEENIKGAAQGGKPEVKAPKARDKKEPVQEAEIVDGPTITEGQIKMVRTKLIKAGLLDRDLLMFLQIPKMEDIKQSELTAIVQQVDAGSVPKC